MSRIKELFEMYREVDEEKLFFFFLYFLEAVMPVFF
jgi:mannonate dehydratase